MSDCELIPQPHGGAIFRGVPNGAARNGTSMRAVRRQVRDLFAEVSVEMAHKVIALCRSRDERVSVIAVKEYHDRFYGKVTERPIYEDDSRAMLDLSHLTNEQAAELAAALAKVRELTGYRNVIEGDVEE